MLLKVLSAALSGGLIVVLFLAIIPKVTEFESVGSAIRSMDPVTVILLLVMAILIRIVLAAAYSVLTPGLSLWRSLIAREASSAVSNVIPGPSGTAAQYVILRSWGVGVERFARATVAVSVSTDVLILAAPGAGFVFWTLLGQPAAAGGDHAWAFGLGAVILSVVSIAVVAAVGRSVRLAAWLGKLGQGCVNPFRRLFDKTRITDWPDQCVHLRADLIDVLKERGGSLLFCVGSGYLLNGVLLVACLWACGPEHRRAPAVTRAAAVLRRPCRHHRPDHPGGVGITEIAYTAVYVTVLGESAQAR